MSDALSVPLRRLSDVRWSPVRHREPVTIGIPFPKGLVGPQHSGWIDGPDNRTPVQLRVLDKWSDGSARWLLLDTILDSHPNSAREFDLRLARSIRQETAASLKIHVHPLGIDVSTAGATFGFRKGGAYPFSSVSSDTGESLLDERRSGLTIEHEGSPARCIVSEVEVCDAGPCRVELGIRGFVEGGLPLEVFGRAEIFASTPTIRLSLTLRNPRRARHTGGQWPLGDPGSVLLRSVTLKLGLPKKVERVSCAPELGSAQSEVRIPFTIHQESSGGKHWQKPVHRNRLGQVPWRYRGYRCQSGETEWHGLRASPLVGVEAEAGRIDVAIPQFWENFPQAIAVDDSRIEIGLFPAINDLHELQGGEQKTHRIVLAFGGDQVSDPPLVWVHDPLLVFPSTDWSSAALSLSFPISSGDGRCETYLGLVDEGLDNVEGFPAKREAADEYGWRNFGDIPADHESAFQPPDRPFVSHYNNQYDAVAGFALHFLRTGDFRWWRLMDDLARHVTDIDIYHTRHDKAAYNGGLFWHTSHYADAGTSTHRTYPFGGHESGGPASEHNYNTGLMLHYFLTGDSSSKESAIGLAQWVLDLDDGRQTPFRLLAAGPTGLASASGSMAYHGPGRGGGNSINACLVGYRLTARPAFLAKVEELIRRCVHPRQNIEALNLLDAERRWFYTVFLQAVGSYLEVQEERGQFHEMTGYARASLLHYGRWMATHERPYLDHPETLEYPTETWAAQELRKADVFVQAARYALESERTNFLERSRFFRDYAVDTLARMPTRRYTRPMVLVLGNGHRLGLADRPGELDPVQPAITPPGWRELSFMPQKTVAVRRAAWLCAASLAGTLLAGALLFLRD